MSIFSRRSSLDVCQKARIPNTHSFWTLTNNSNWMKNERTKQRKCKFKINDDIPKCLHCSAINRLFSVNRIKRLKLKRSQCTHKTVFVIFLFILTILEVKIRYAAIVVSFHMKNEIDCDFCCSSHRIAWISRALRNIQEKPLFFSHFPRLNRFFRVPFLSCSSRLHPM